MATSEWLKDLKQAAGIVVKENGQGKPIEPFTAPEMPSESLQTSSMSKSSCKSAKRAQGAFIALTDPTRDYRAMYAALFRFHERHNPPTAGSDGGAFYWAAVSDDMTATAQQFDNDPFFLNLLCAVYEALEREYKG